MSWSSREKLFDAIVSSTALYGSYAWGLLDFELIERLQSKFLRRVLDVWRYVPGNVLRLETGR